MISFRGFCPGRRFRTARRWSNGVLRQIAPLFEGDVLNVSGWLDEDKEGGLYQDYFSKARSYSITNYGGFRGESPQTVLHLELEADLPVALAGCADVVFNHTTLEHVFNVQKAAETLARVTRDIVIGVVPAAQEEHSSDSYGDYWRFMSVGLRRLFECQGLQTLLLISLPIRDCAIHHFLWPVAIRNAGVDTFQLLAA